MEGNYNRNFNKYNRCQKTPGALVGEITEEQRQDCKKWFDGMREEGINPKTNRNIVRGRRVWNKIEEECQSIVREIDSSALEIPDKNVSIAYPDDIEELLDDVSDIVTENWDNEKLSLRSTYNSDDNIKDLFSGDEIRQSLENPDSGKLLVLRKKNDEVEPEFSDERDYDPDLDGFGSSDAKKPLMDCATEFNTFNFLGDMTTRIQFIGLVIKVFNRYLETTYRMLNRDGINVDTDNYNIMFKGGTTVRFLLKELVRDFTRDLENHIFSKISKYIMLSDYDFEMMISPEAGISNDTFVKLNVITYIVVLRLRNYLEKHKTYFFSFFQLLPSIQSKKIEELRQYMQDKVNSSKPTVTTINGEEISNFYHDIVIDYVELSSNCGDGSGRLLNYNPDGPDVPQLKKYQSKTPNPLIGMSSNCRTDFALITDISPEKEVPKASIAFITAKQLFKRYGIEGKSKNYCINSKEEGGQFYVTHNPVVENRLRNLKFQLNRIKYSYTIYFRKGDKFYKDFIPGEILDLSCAYKSDRKAGKFINSFSNNQNLLKFSFINYDLNYFSYSIWGHIHDTISMLFVEPDHQPWAAGKPDKRIYRLLYLTILYFFTCHYSVLGNSRVRLTYGKKIRYIKKLINMIQEDFPSRSKFKIDILELLRYHFREVSYYKHMSPKEYKSFKAKVLDLFNDLVMVIQTEYNITRNQELTIGPVDSGVLTISDPSLYGF